MFYFTLFFLDKLSKVCKQLALLRCFLISVYGNFTHDILNIWLLQKFSLLFIAWVIILTLVLLPFDPSMMSASDEALRYTDLRINIDYLIPIKIRAPLIFAHLDCAKIKGSKFAQYECAKIKGRRKNATNEWKNGKFTV